MNLGKSTQRSTAERAALARERFLRTGQTINSWARARGYKPQLVHWVLSGTRPCRHGMSHRIAVELGIKDGVIEEEKP
jgi:gp16 family phage-associated protein